MFNIHKRNLSILQVLRNHYITSKAYIYFAIEQIPDGYDPYENKVSYTNVSVRAIPEVYVREIASETLVWKTGGTREQGAIELICDQRYKEWFKQANKIVIKDIEYEVFKDAVASRASIQERPFNMMRVILRRK